MDRASEPEFVAWYAAYPRKAAPNDALKAWRQTSRQRPPLAEMLAALEWQTRLDFGLRPLDRVPYPATYLRDGQWANEQPRTNGVALNDRERRGVAASQRWLERMEASDAAK